jgi:hypothetical protein
MTETRVLVNEFTTPTRVRCRLGGQAPATETNQRKLSTNRSMMRPSIPRAGAPSSPTTTPVANVTLRFGGGARLYAAAGPVVSLLPVKEFQRATGVDGSGASATIIDYKTNSRTRIAPMIFIHWRPIDKPWFFISAGATAKTDNQKTSAGFLFGPTFGFLGNYVFVTGGAYVGQQQQLAGNLHVGQTVPSSLQGEIPVQQSYHWNVGFSINFKLAGIGKADKSNTKTPTDAKQPPAPKK